MKKFLAIFAIASLAIVACQEKPSDDPDPTPVEKAFSVSPETISVGANDTSASINVTAEVKWTAKSDNAKFTLDPAAGESNATITVSFPANNVTEEVKAAITISTYDPAAKQQTWVVNITQAAAEAPPAEPKVLAEWEFSADAADFFKQNFEYELAKDPTTKLPTPESTAAGFLNDSHYCPSNIVEGGKIRFWNGVDKTSLNPDGRCKRGVGEKGEPCWYGNWTGDIVYITAPTEPLTAGTKLHIVLPLRPNTRNTLKYWLLEIKDGENYVPVGEVKNYGDAKYNVELIFDPAGSKDVGTDDGGNPVYPDNPQQINTIIDREYTLTANVSEVEYRLTCVALMMADGSRDATDIGDIAEGKRANPVLRIAGKDTTNGGCRPVGVNTKIEIIY